MIDTHAHLSDEDAAEVLQRARVAGVTQVIDVGTTIAGAREVLARAEREEGVYACLGVHPARVVICEAVRRLLLRPGVRLLPPPEGRIERSSGIFPDRFVLGLGSEDQEG